MAMKDLRILDAGDGRFVIEKRGEEVDLRKNADALVWLAKSGSCSSWQLFTALHELAKLVGKEGETDAQAFDRAFAKGEASRVPRSAEIMGELSRISALEKMTKAGPFG